MTTLRTSRRTFLKTGGAGALSLMLAARRAPAAPEKQPPNLLFMHTDQQHCEAVSAFGCAHVRTPAMDRLAAAGTSFSLSYSANPVCCPARTCWYTGRASSENGVIMNDQWPIAPDMPDLGQWLGARGYDPVYAGKWHITGRAFTQSFRVLTPGSGVGEVTDMAVSRAAEGFLRSRKAGGKPFLLHLGFLQPHDCCYWVFEHGDGTPLTRLGAIPADLPPLPTNHGFDPNEPEALKRRHGEKKAAWSAEHWRWYLWNYYRMVEMADAEIGRVLDALEDAGLAENTLVIVTADNGTPVPRAKANVYDWGVHVPLAVMWPARAPAGRAVSDFAGFPDLAPTLLEAAGLPVPAGMSGRSLLKTVLSPAEGRVDPARDFTVNGIEWHGNLPPVDIAARMIRDDRYTYIVNYSATPRFEASTRAPQPDDRYAANAEKLDVMPLLAAHPDRPELQRFVRLIKAPRPREELYDCVADPDHLQNLADRPECAEVKRALRARLESYQRQTNDPRLTGEMALFEQTLKFVQTRKAAGYADNAAHQAKAAKKGATPQ